jgi:hypothetical protein
MIGTDIIGVAGPHRPLIPTSPERKKIPSSELRNELTAAVSERG